MRRWLAMGVLVALASCSLPRRDPRGPLPDDPYAKNALQLLREATRAVDLRRATLADICPQYHAPGPANLTWKEALAYANKHYGSDRVKRSLFLRRCLSKGQPASHLAEMSTFWMRSGDDGYTISFGSGGRFSYQRAIYDEAGHKAVMEWLEGRAGADKKVARPVPKPVATIHGWQTGRTDGVLNGTPQLGLSSVTVKGTVFRELGFDETDRLSGFVLHRVVPGTGRQFWVSGERAVGDRRCTYSIAVYRADDEDLMDAEEGRKYDEELQLTERSVGGDADWCPRYAEYYISGFLYKREHYRKGQGVWSDAAVVERFPLPRPDLIDEASVEKAAMDFAELSSWGLGGRARDILLLSGPRAVPALKRCFNLDDEFWLEPWATLLAEIGSAEAIAWLLPLAAHPDADLYHTALDAVRENWPTCRRGIIEAFQSPASLPRVRRFCLKVMGEAKDASLVALVAKALREKDVCVSAANALRNIGSPEAKRILREAADLRVPPGPEGE